MKMEGAKRAPFFFALTAALTFACSNLQAVDSTAISGIRDLKGMTADTVAGKEKFVTPGSHSFTVPEGIGRIWVTLSAGGGGGSGSRLCNSSVECTNHCGDPGSCSNPVVYGAAGGIGGYDNRQKITVTPGSVIAVTVGGGGKGNTAMQYYCSASNSCNGWAGGNSCVDGLCVTGGGGGVTRDSASSTGVSGQPLAHGGAGGGAGGNGSPGWVEIEW